VISAPRLLVHGGGDTDVPPEHSHRAVAAIPGATLEVLDGRTHLAVHTHPDDERAQGRAPDLLRAAPGRG
jgi:pimeloyl-ACP methyl ester carboxylesterase